MIPGIVAGQALSDGGGGGGVAADILAALVAWWDFEENTAGSQFFDSHGSNHLSIIRDGASGTSSGNSSASGLLGRCYSPAITGDQSVYIPRANTALDMTNSDWSMWQWLKADPAISGATRFVMGRVGNGSTGRPAWLSIDSFDNNLRFSATSDGSSATAISAGVSCSTSAFSLVVATFDRTNNLIRIRVKRTAVNANQTTAFASALYATASNSNFCINDGLSSDSSFFSGDRNLITATIDSAGFVNKALTDDEVDYLYNGGSGTTYANLVADA